MSEKKKSKKKKTLKKRDISKKAREKARKKNLSMKKKEEEGKSTEEILEEKKEKFNMNTSEMSKEEMQENTRRFYAWQTAKKIVERNKSWLEAIKDLQELQEIAYFRAKSSEEVKKYLREYGTPEAVEKYEKAMEEAPELMKPEEVGLAQEKELGVREIYGLAQELKKGKTWGERLRTIRRIREKGFSDKEIEERLREYGGKNAVEEYEEALEKGSDLLEKEELMRGEEELSWIAQELEEKGNWKEYLREIRKFKERGMSEEELKERMEMYGGKDAARAIERAKKEAPELMEKSLDEVAQERYKDLFNVDEILVPEKARETAEEKEKEIKGKVRGYKVKGEEGKDVLVLVPRFKEEFTKERERHELEHTDKYGEEVAMREPEEEHVGRQYSSEEKRKQFERGQKKKEELDKGELVTGAHTHPEMSYEEAKEMLEKKAKEIEESPYTEETISEEEIEQQARKVSEEPSSKPSRPDKLNISRYNRPELIVSKQGATVVLPEDLENKEKKVKYASKEKIGKLLGKENIPEERAKRKGLKLLKKKEEKES